jgi:hypothetical protein
VQLGRAANAVWVVGALWYLNGNPGSVLNTVALVSGSVAIVLCVGLWLATNTGPDDTPRGSDAGITRDQQRS